MPDIFVPTTRLKLENLDQSEKNDVRDCLLIAAGIVEEAGLCTGYLVAEDGRVCLMGSVALAIGYTVNEMKENSHNKGGNIHNDGFYQVLNQNPAVIALGEFLGFTEAPAHKIGEWSDENPMQNTKIAAKVLRDAATFVEES